MVRFVRARTTVLVAAAVLAAVSIASCASPRISSKVTAASIRKISPGMSRMDVVSLLGQPLRERPGDLLDYAIPGAALHGAFSFWIALDSHGTVDTVHVEKYPWIADHYAIYEARRDRPVYEHPEFARVVDGAR